MSVIKTKRFCGLLVSGYIRRIEKVLSKSYKNKLLLTMPTELFVLCIEYYPPSLAIHFSGFIANRKSGKALIIKNDQLRYHTLCHNIDEIQIINIYPQYQDTYHWIQTLKGELYTFDGESLSYRTFPQFDSKDFAFMSTTFCAKKDLNNIGDQYTYIVTKQNKIYSLSNRNMSLEYGEYGAKLLQSNIFNKYKVINIQCGHLHALFLMDNGHIVCNGSNQYGECGVTINKTKYIETPQLVPSISDIVAISVGKSSNLCLDKNGNAFGFGHNHFGQLGLGHNTSSIVDIPTILSCFENTKLRQIKCGENHGAAITMDYKLYLWGSNNFGQTANPNYDDTIIPSQVPVFEKQNIEHVECGSNHTVITTSNGDVYTFGHNQYNQCIPCSKHQLWKPVKLNRLDMDTSNNSYLMGIIATADNTFILSDDTFN